MDNNVINTPTAQVPAAHEKAYAKLQEQITKATTDHKDSQINVARLWSITTSTCGYLRDPCEDIMANNQWKPQHWHKIDVFLKNNT